MRRTRANVIGTGYGLLLRGLRKSGGPHVLKAVNDYEQSAERFMQYGAKVLRPQDLENYKLTEDQVTRILHAPSLADEMIAEMSLGDEVLGQTLPWSKTYS